jgi:hypothetical protein
MTKKKSTPTLEEFLIQKQIKECNVCALPDEIRAQVEGAGSKGRKRADQLAWLEAIGHGEVTDSSLSKHYSARHPRVE